ncbi:AbrB family transcriptional regulator [Bacillus sp. NTK074B]|nr:AbrB family transcriptional regulator [Bacillus sp. NTK074B]
MFILLSSGGGYLLSLTGMPIAWMVGTLAVAGVLSYRKHSKWNRILLPKNPIQSYWRYIGQGIIGIQLGHQINLSVINMFKHHYVLITVVLLFSILVALLCGVLLWRFSQTDLLTGLFSTTPGGITAMPSIAEEVGANTLTVSLVQLIRIFLVVGTVPIFASFSSNTDAQSSSIDSTGLSPVTSVLHPSAFIWTGILILGCICGYILGKRMKLPAPWLVGGMIGVACFQMVGTSIQRVPFTMWWPHWVTIIAQILIGASIGSRLSRQMFAGTKNILVLAIFTSSLMIAAMGLCAYGVTEITHIPFATTLLAFAPGGVAEMATTSVALHADSAFVVSVQVLRLISIFIIIPPFLKLLSKQTSSKPYVNEM